MSFLEDLRKQMLAKAEAQKIARQLAEQSAKREEEELGRKREEEIKIRVSLEKENLQKIKEQVEQSGVKRLAQEIIDIGAAVRLREDGLKGFYMRGGLDDHTGSTYVYGAELILEEKKIEYLNETHTYYIGITVSLDGTVTFKGAKKRQKNRYVSGSRLGGFKGFWHKEDVYDPLKISINKEKWRVDKNVLEDAFGKIYRNPKVTKVDHTPRQTDFSHCLHGDSLISVPSGFVPVKNLKSGDLVWTVDEFGNRVQSAIIKTNRRLVSKAHKMAHIVLKDGRELIVSPGHPTIDNKEIGYLVKGQILDKSQIISVKIMPYRRKYTHDILPSGNTGRYWANNILIGSTLSDQLKQTQWCGQSFV